MKKIPKKISNVVIRKNDKGYSVIQKTRNVYTMKRKNPNKVVKTNLGNFKTLGEAKKTQKIAKKLIDL